MPDPRMHATQSAFADVWRRRLHAEFFAGNLTRAYRDVLWFLLSFRGHGGEIYPSHQALAGRATCSVSTVQRALAMGSKLGLVHWWERRKRVGWRSLRTSNRYFLNVPPAPAEAGQRPKFPRRTTTGQTAGGHDSLDKQAREVALTAMAAEAATAGDLLKRARDSLRERMRPILRVGRPRPAT